MAVVCLLGVLCLYTALSGTYLLQSPNAPAPGSAVVEAARYTPPLPLLLPVPLRNYSVRTGGARHAGNHSDVPPLIEPVARGANGDLLCFKQRGSRAQLPRFQSFCLVQRLCHTHSHKWVLPLPPKGAGGRAAELLRDQSRLAVVEEADVVGYAVDPRMAMLTGHNTPHFPEWVDGPLFLFAYQKHAWRFGAPQAQVFIDARWKRGVMSFITPFRDMVTTHSGVDQVYDFESPAPRNTCFRAVLQFVAHLEEDAFVTELEPRKRESTIQKYEVGLRRHFFGPNDGLLWHNLALDFLDKQVQATRARRWAPAFGGEGGATVGGVAGDRAALPPACCSSLSEYHTELEAARGSVAARSKKAVASATGVEAAAPAFTIAVLQRKEGRRFADMRELMGCLQGHVARTLGVQPHRVLVREVVFEGGVGLREQVAAISSSDMFFQMHGAGGINYLWLPPCAVFFDLFAFNHFTPRFYGPPAENMGLVYAYGHFYPATKEEMPSCLPEDVRQPGKSYECMNLRHYSCRSCVRSMSTNVRPPCAPVGKLLELALLRRHQCLAEHKAGLEPGSLHPGQFARFNGGSMDFEIAHEIFDEQAVDAAVARARGAMSLDSPNLEK